MDVVAVAVFDPSANFRLTPLAGAVNVTTTPSTGFPPASWTTTPSGAKELLITALCASVTAVIVAGEPGVFVSKKFAAPVMLGEVACTV
jgi:hypothetical protein